MSVSYSVHNGWHYSARYSAYDYRDNAKQQPVEYRKGQRLLWKLHYICKKILETYTESHSTKTIIAEQ